MFFVIMSFNVIIYVRINERGKRKRIAKYFRICYNNGKVYAMVRISKKSFLYILIAISCVFMLLLEIFPIDFMQNPLRNEWIGVCLQNLLGATAAILLAHLWGLHLFKKVRHWLYLLPCLVIAIDNFPFYSYFSGNMQIIRKEFLDVVLFTFYCITIGLFEEIVFRGILFSILCERFSKDKKGLVKAFVFSSVIFALAHLFNLFVGAGIGETLLQVCYTVLTGGLFAFAFIKTKNILSAVFIHAVYNFSGLILSTSGLGTGIVFDLGTVITMFIVSVVVGIFVLYALYKYEETERKELYERLNIKENSEN